MSALQHAAPAESYVARLAREKHERRARIAAKAWSPGPKVVEIREAPVADTKIPVIACNGQVVIVTGSEIKAAKVQFEAVSKVATIDKIKAAVCRHFHVSMNDLLSQRREFVVIMPRHIAMYLSKTLTDKTYPAIGRQFGGRDHSTVMNAVGKIERLLKTSDSVREDVEALRKRLTGVVAA